MDDGARLRGRRVLVVEDDWFIATYATEALERAGATVLGPVASAADALERLEGERLEGERPDAATLNFTLLDGNSLPVARRLGELGVPFLFLSAQGEASLPPDLRARPRLDKPFAGFQVAEAVTALLSGA